MVVGKSVKLAKFTAAAELDSSVAVQDTGKFETEKSVEGRRRYKAVMSLMFVATVKVGRAQENGSRTHGSGLANRPFNTSPDMIDRAPLFPWRNGPWPMETSERSEALRVPIVKGHMCRGSDGSSYW